MISQKAEVPLGVVPERGKAPTKKGDYYQSPVQCDHRVEADSVGLGSLSSFGRFDVDATAFAVEINRAGLQRKERPVPSGAHVLAGVPLGAALTDENIASDDWLAAELLDAQTLGIRVATVAGGALTFVMCPCSVLLLLRWLMPSVGGVVDLRGGTVTNGLDACQSTNRHGERRQWLARVGLWEAVAGPTINRDSE